MADLFDGGPLCAFQRRVGLIKPGDRRVRRRAFIVAALGWAPLAILTAIQGISTHDQSLWYFLRDVAVHARFLIAAPLLVTAESWCLPKLSHILEHFLDSGLVDREADRTRLRSALAATHRLLNAAWVDILTVLLAYGIATAVSTGWSPSDLPKWYVLQTNGAQYSAAGQWHLLVSLPLLLVLLLGWMWRQILWWRLLWLISKLKLKLIAAHPDRGGGLRFLEIAVRGYWPLGFAFATIVAGRIANLLRTGASVYDSKFLLGGLLAFVLIFFLLPFTVFIPSLLRLKDTGTFEYGAVGRALGKEFEAKWLSERPSVTEGILEENDFSATIDLYSTVGNVYQIRFFPVGFAAIRALAVVTMLPFLPVALFAVPFDVVLNGLKRLLL